MTDPDLTILILCLDEEKSIATVIGEARGFLERNAIRGEIIVVDNNSRDRSAVLAEEAGANVIVERRKGYGHAIKAGIDGAHGRFIILGDGDGEHDLGRLEPFWEKLQAGFDFVFGNRFAEALPPGAMPFWRRHVGNPLLSGAGRLFFRAPISDFHCGLRAFRTASVCAAGLRCSGMELASEMIVKAVGMNMRVTEVPVIQRPPMDPDRRSHLRAWQDGWRHLCLLLMLSPRWLFFLPACVMFSLGAFAMTMPLLHPVQVGGVFGTYTMIFGSAFLICGTQIICLGLLSNAFCESIGLAARRRWIFDPYRRRRHLKGSLAAGFALVLSGLAGSAWSLFVWAHTAGDDPETRLRILIPSVNALIVGIQVMFSTAGIALLVIQGSAGPVGREIEDASSGRNETE